jgi:hypothetical protein
MATTKTHETRAFCYTVPRRSEGLSDLTRGEKETRVCDCRHEKHSLDGIDDPKAEKRPLSKSTSSTLVPQTKILTACPVVFRRPVIQV